MTLGRREFVVGTVGAATLTSLLSGCAEGGAGDSSSTEPRDLVALPVDTTLFAHGVASGDPLDDRVILWTRVSAQEKAVTLQWVIARDAALSDVVASGNVSTDGDKDFTAKVDVKELSAGTTYYYVFALPGLGRSQTGRTRTLPGVDTTHVRFAFTSCSNYNNGYFHAYRQIAQRADLDVWVHLGDYIYEYAEGVYGDPALGRTYDRANETISVDDYRARYAQHRRDPDCQEVHRQHPLIIVWDDHEVADNSSLVGAVEHDPAVDGDWETRKRNGTKAFFEWLPIRVEYADKTPAIYRTFKFGKLFDLIMLDTRLAGRDLQAGGLESPGDPALWTDPTRHLLGTDQEKFLSDALKESRERGATWRVLGNQVMFAENKNPLTNAILNADAWDGYQATRDRVVADIKMNGIDNLVVLTGDIHTSWAFELAEKPFDIANYDPATGKGSFGVELVGPSVTSRGLEEPADEVRRGQATSLLPTFHPHLKFVEVTRKGYVLLDVTDERVQAEWYFIGNHKLNTEEGRREELGKVFTCASKSARLVEGSGASAAKAAPELAPA